MPIYAYRCESCGHEKDVLRKLSDAPLTQCPACGKDTFSKQVTAAGFQLKGSGWYVTDFRGGNSNNGNKSNTGSGDNGNAGATNSDSAASGSDNASASKPAESASAASAPSSEVPKPASSSGSNAAASGTA
jgi:putative FmdB family regulatory protein